jgi:hypothetical protein
MNLPALLLGSVLATIYGVAFHVWRGGGLSRLALYIGLSWAGFWLGQFIASKIGFVFISAGQLHIGAATLSSIIFLGIGYWLSLVDTQRK